MAKRGSHSKRSKKHRGGKHNLKLMARKHGRKHKRSSKRKK